MKSNTGIISENSEISESAGILEEESQDLNTQRIEIEKNRDKNILNSINQQWIKNQIHSRKLQKYYSDSTFNFMKRFILITGIITFGFIVAICFGVKIHYSIIVTLISIIPSAMVLFAWVIRGMFKYDNHSDKQ